MLFKSFNIVICSMFFFSACNQLPKDNSKLSLKYLGAAGWEINDENSTVLVDPYLSRVKPVSYTHLTLPTKA